MRVDIPGRSPEERVPTTRRVVPLSPRLNEEASVRVVASGRSVSRTLITLREP